MKPRNIDQLMAEFEVRKAFKAAGYAGMMPEGHIVDRREHPEAIPVQKNTFLGFAEPKTLEDDRETD